MSMKIFHERRSKDITFLGGHNIQCIPHLHQELELICMYEGEAIAYADTTRCQLQGGDVFLTFPNQIHSYEKVTPETHFGLIFKADLIPEMAEIFRTGYPTAPVLKNALNNPRIRSLVDALEQSRERADFPHLSELQRGYLLALCAELVPAMKVKKLSTGDSNTLRAIVSFCTQNYAEKLSLAVLEEQLHLNRYYISHLLSGRLGIRFNEYINSLRVTEACRYLLNSDHSVTEIAALVGFSTSRTFNRAFVHQTGVSPSEYRRQRMGDLKLHIQNSAEPDGIEPSLPKSSSARNGCWDDDCCC